jgi:acyl carrier protein
MKARLLEMINKIRAGAGLSSVEALDEGTDLRSDLGLDSFGLAELTVHIEEAYGVDVFADGLVSTVGEIINKLPGDR